MSVFKRLGNVARGKVMEISRSLTDPAPDDEPDELDPDRPVRRPGASASTTKAPPLDEAGKREMLERLLGEGLLTEDEYASKLAALDAPAVAKTRKKRTL